MSCLRHCLLAALLLTLSSATTTRAQSDESSWVFVPLIIGDEELPLWAPAAIDALVEEAKDHELSVWPRTSSAGEFEKRHSEELSAITRDDVLALQRLAAAAVRSIAAADPRTALTQLEAAARQYEHSPDEYNREDPKLVLDLCLFRARALLETAVSPAKVKEEIRSCRLRIPLEIEIDWMKHTNVTVRQLVREVMADLVGERNGTLEVRAGDDCQVRVDGIAIGRVNQGVFRANDIIRGTHRVATFCNGKLGRAHTVNVSENTQPLTIDPSFEAVVRTRPLLHLRVPEQELSHLDNYVRSLSVTLGRETSITLVRVSANGDVILDRTLSDGGRAHAELPPPAQVNAPWSDIDLAGAVLALLSGQSRSAPSLPQEPLEESLGETWLRIGEPELARHRVASLTLLSIGSAGLLASFSLHVGARSGRASNTKAYNAGTHEGTAQAATRMGDAALALGAAGGLITTLGYQELAFYRFNRSQSNVALLTSGALAGASLLAVGGWQLRASEEACDACRVQKDNAGELGVTMFVLGGGLTLSSLLSALVLHVPQRALDRRKATASISPGFGTLHVMGKF